MKINYLREFVVLESIGQFSAAAAELNMTQGTLSKHIISLEKKLGVSLFKRSGNQNVTLTEFGRILLPYAKQIADIQDEYTEEFSAQEGKNKMDYHLKIGLSPAAWRDELVDLLVKFNAENRDISVVFQEKYSEVLLEEIQQGQCDFAFIRDVRVDEEAGVEVRRFMSDSLAAILPRKHPLASGSTVSLKQLEHEDFLLLHEQSWVHKTCVEECEKCGFQPKIVFTGISSESIYALVDRGFGISFLLNKLQYVPTSANFVYVDIVPEIISSVDLLFRKNNVSPEMQRFLHYIQPYMQF